MIGPGTGVRVYLACGVTDMRKGISGLAMLAQTVLRQKPASGAVFAFRGRRGDRLKLLYWDGQGFCLYYKIFNTNCSFTSFIIPLVDSTAAGFNTAIYRKKLFAMCKNWFNVYINC